MAVWGNCEECGDETEPGDDPRPELCDMCAKAGRGGFEPREPGKQWPPDLEHKASPMFDHPTPCRCSPPHHYPGGIAWCYFRIQPSGRFVDIVVD
jgi:hypothetical protein